ncbi:hypothetical protein CLOM_g17288 [Closterium sp. NIES-68]|nr:hypothetical protein CLOM_g17288 [Closterium sp. NIES-68]GJP79107.1 hypothetical protein CLOP_g9349 [Closterium sp. NIES-67]
MTEINHILPPLLDECVVVYLDDILTYSRDMQQHVQHLRRVFDIVRREQFYVKLSNANSPSRKSNSYDTRFVPQYAKIATPPTKLLKKNTPYKWEPKHQEAVEQLKQARTSAPVVILPDPERDYVIETDASDQAVGAVLMQDQGNGLQPITYLSKKLHGAEQNYRIHDKEALAIIIAFKTWRSRTEETAQLFVCYIISQHGISTSLISDRNPKFTSKFWKELMSLLGTKLAMSSAYHPQIDGQTERLNQIVEQLLRAACNDELSKWDLHLPVLEFAYKNVTHVATRQTSFFLCYELHPLMPQKPTVGF